MLSFLAAVVYMCMAQSDTTTRVITGVLLGTMTIIVLAVLYSSWGKVAPSSKTLWQRNKEMASGVKGFTTKAVDSMLRSFLTSRTRNKVAGEDGSV